MDEATETAEGPQKKKSVFSLGRIIPLGILVAGLTAFFALDLAQYISLNALKEHRELLQSWVTNYGAMSALVFAGIYALAVAFSIPGAVFRDSRSLFPSQSQGEGRASLPDFFSGTDRPA